MTTACAHTVAALLLVWPLSACSSPAARPPALGDCMPGDEASCVTGPIVEAGPPPVRVVVPPQSDGGSSSPGCAVQPSDSMCAQCENARCCTLLNACLGSLACYNLASCETGPTCIGSGTCASKCEAMYPSGITLYGELNSCLTLNCAVCSELGVGDPCLPQGFPCNPGLTCDGLWCTRGCGRASDCVGLGAGGGNALGLPGECIAASSGNACAPGCVTDSDCAPFAGTYCMATTSVDRLSVQVCAVSP